MISHQCFVCHNPLVIDDSDIDDSDIELIVFKCYLSDHFYLYYQRSSGRLRYCDFLIFDSFHQKIFEITTDFKERATNIYLLKKYYGIYIQEIFPWACSNNTEMFQQATTLLTFQ